MFEEIIPFFGFFGWGAIFVGAAVGSIFENSVLPRIQEHRTRKLRRKQIAKANGTPIAEASDGLVLLRGKVVPRATLKAPVSGTACVGYQVFLRSNDLTDQNTGCFQAVRKIEEFELEDGTGRALIQPSSWRALINEFELEQGPEKVLIKPEDWQAVFKETAKGPRENLPPHISDAIMPISAYPIDVDLNAVHYFETSLMPDEEIYVWGHGYWIQDTNSAEAGYREVARRLVVTAAVDFPILIAHDIATISDDRAYYSGPIILPYEWQL